MRRHTIKIDVITLWKLDLLTCVGGDRKTVQGKEDFIYGPQFTGEFIIFHQGNRFKDIVGILIY